MPVTQRDIAREVGVSQATVSDVIHGRARGRVSEETRRRILETARRLAYRPNVSAQALRLRQSRQIVYMTTQAADRQFGVLGEMILGGLARGLAEREFRLLIEVAASPQHEVTALRGLVNAGICDGFLLRAFEEREAVWEALAGLGRPFLIIGQCADPRFPSIAHDAPGMILSALHLLTDRSHRRLGLVLGQADNIYFRLLREAWLASAPDFGVEPDRFVASCAGRAEAEKLASEWLALPDGPTAVVCFANPQAFGITAAARRSHPIGCGFDLVTAGNAAGRWIYEPGTWYFDMDPERLGRRSATELLRLLEGSPSPGAIRLLPELSQI